MTRINFYFNVIDKHKLLVDLVQTALIKRRQVVILVPDNELIKRVSDDLWQDTASSFLPNCTANDLHAAITPVVIGLQAGFLDSSCMHDDMLINLTTIEPYFFSRFTQLVEVVSDEEHDKINARNRYKFYRDRGYDIKNINHAQL